MVESLTLYGFDHLSGVEYNKMSSFAFAKLLIMLITFKITTVCRIFNSADIGVVTGTTSKLGYWVFCHLETVVTSHTVYMITNNIVRGNNIGCRRNNLLELKEVGTVV